MITFTGKGVCGGTAIGKVSLMKKKDRIVKRTRIEDAEKEKERFGKAKEVTLEELTQVYEKALVEVGEANAQIFDIHRMMVEDPDYNESVKSIIETQMVSAEYAVAVTSDNFSEMFAQMEDAYMKARAADVKDISDRIIKNLTDAETETFTEENMIICAEDLTPSETVLLDKDKVLAFVTAFGSANSHTAILSRNNGIPAIIGVGKEFIESLHNGEDIVVDGNSGMVYVDPDEKTIAEMREKQRKEKEHKELLQTLKGKENVTIDGRKVNIYANIGSVSDIGNVLANDAGGIGLFRSEFLYLGSEDYPTEEEQFTAYKKVLESMAGKKVIIRTLDIGADKQVDYFKLDKEDNPALGVRAIRLCMSRPDVFRTQLRALYRASVYGNLGIMFPMICAVDELKKVLAIAEDVKKELTDQGLEYNKDTEVGIMVETPASALISDELAPLVDFFSVGTNDLTQYTLAVDRQNRKLEYLAENHRAVFKLIELATKNAHANGIWIGICGELAADCTLTEEFLRMGVDELSVSPGYVLSVRDTVRKLDLG